MPRRLPHWRLRFLCRIRSQPTLVRLLKALSYVGTAMPPWIDPPLHPLVQVLTLRSTRAMTLFGLLGPMLVTPAVCGLRCFLLSLLSI